ncbi:MAG: HAD family hydrolase [Clostridia bacterium]|nr:HAD family hydrolase [Clostridia bacterium]
MIKGVIFDLDGTILNTIDDLSDSMNYMLRHFGFPEHSDLFYHMQAVGSGAKNYVKNCLPEDVRENEDQLEACLAFYKTYYNEHSSIKTKPYDGVAEMMQYLKDANIQIAILSNKPDEPVKELAKCWFSEFSIPCVYGERVGIPRKPDPEGPLAIAHELGLAPSEIAFVGDSDVDIKTGLNAGMTAIGVLWGFRTKEQLQEAGAEYLVDSKDEFIALIKQLNS